MDLNPFVETKITKIETGEVMATFRVPNTVVVMGQGEGLKASLELHGVLNCQVNATLTFFRNTTYVGNIHTENILSQNKCVEIHQNDTLIKWTVVVPVMKRISYSDETITKYSVRYYLKVISLPFNVVCEKKNQNYFLHSVRSLCGTIGC